MASVMAVLVRAASRARATGEPDFALELEQAKERCMSVMASADNCIASAEPNPADPTSYCVPVELWDRLSADIASMGGVV